jgi:hypothetical protein
MPAVTALSAVPVGWQRMSRLFGRPAVARRGGGPFRSPHGRAADDAWV